MPTPGRQRLHQARFLSSARCSLGRLDEMDVSFDIPATESTGAMLNLLARMKEEAERTSQITSALDAERLAHQAQLEDLIACNQRTEAEVAEIEARTLAAAGNAHANADLLAIQQAERLALEAEAERLGTELTHCESQLGIHHEQVIDECSLFATELPALRCAFRKRSREGHSNAVRLACSLQVLESECSDMGLLSRARHM